MDQKFRFQEHIKYAADRCTKLIHILSRAVKLSWGIKSGAIATIYKGAILPLLTYGAPVWIDAMKYEHNRQKNIRVQRLINHLTPNGHYMGRTAQLTSRCCILYVYSTNIHTEYFKHVA